MRTPNVLALIPARKGSKRIVDKNFKPFFCGYSLTDLSVATALEIPEVKHVVVSTDLEDYETSLRLTSEEKDRVTVRRRPDSLATDDATTESVIVDVWDNIYHTEGITHILLLQPTSPFRKASTIRKVLNLTHLSQLIYTSYFSTATEVMSSPFRVNVINGNIYLIPVESIRDLTAGYRIFDILSRSSVESSPIESIDIDTKEDWIIAKGCLNYALSLTHFLGFSNLFRGKRG